PAANGPVNVIAPAGTRIFVGGAFTSVGGRPRRNAAAIDRISEQVTGWDPQVSGPVEAIATKGSRVYLGGHFFQVGGQERRAAAAVDSINGALLDWSPASPRSFLEVNAIVASDA